MLPLPYRILIATASLIVPQPKRNEWRREWEAELWHRAQAGTSGNDMFRCAWGAFRDAAWFRENQRKQFGSDVFRKPLRVEASLLAIALVACLFAGAFRKPVRPFVDPARLVVVERNVSFAAAINWQINPKVLKLCREHHLFTDLAMYRVLRHPALVLHASRNLFDVLGSNPLLGRTFQPGDPDDTAILTYDTWQSRFQSDPAIVGKRAKLGRNEFTVIGVMPRGFWFLSRRIQYFAPLEFDTKAPGAVARLSPGLTPKTAQVELRKLARMADMRWVADSLVLTSQLNDKRLSGLLFALELASICAALGMGFLILKGRGRLRYWGFLGGRIFLTVMALSLLRFCISVRPTGGPASDSLFVFWLFLLSCCAATCLLVIDHRQRCPVCLRILRKPVSIGLWSSQLLDQPATEYLCPAGHGTLYVAETGNAPDHWTVLDESWQDLFAHTE